MKTQTLLVCLALWVTVCHALNISQTLKKEGLTSFQTVLEETMWNETVSVMDFLEDQDLVNLFAPTNAAVNAFTGTLDDVDALLYHASNETFTTDDVTDDQTRTTYHRQETPIRFNLYELDTVATATGANVNLSRVEVITDNGQVNVLTEVMTAPTESIMDQLATTYSSFYKDIEDYDIEDFLGNTPHKGLTVFAPSNAAYNGKNEEQYETLKENRTHFKEVLLSHFVARTVYSEGMSDGTILETISQETELSITHTQGVLYINETTRIESETPALDGVVHGINEILIVGSGAPTILLTCWTLLVTGLVMVTQNH